MCKSSQEQQIDLAGAVVRGRVRPDSVVGTAVVGSCALTCCGWRALRAGSLQMGAGMSDYMSAGRDRRVSCVHIARF